MMSPLHKGPKGDKNRNRSRKSYTLWVTSNRKGQVHSFSLSSGILNLAGGFLSVVMFLLTAIVIDYVILRLQVNESQKLRFENRSLQRQMAVVDSKVRSLEASLERIKSFSTKLKLITSVGDEDRAMKLNVGMNLQGGAHLDSPPLRTSRKPASSDFEMDAMFLGSKAPPAQGYGELVEESKDYSTLSIRIDRTMGEAELREQNVLELYENLIQRQSLLNATPSIRPVHGWNTSSFGYRIDPFSGFKEMHKGLDIAASQGTPVYASAHGVVSYIGHERGYGKIVSIDHGYGVKTRYAHNSKVFVELGQKVRRRDRIAAVGNTGRSSGPHLHYEVRINGVPVDPKNYIFIE